MLVTKMGDLFDSDAQTLVNTVNTVGVMGKGVALEFKKRFPEMYDNYVQRCRRGQVHLGQPYLYRRGSPPWILNFPTKDHWRSVSRLSDIVAGLDYLERHYRAWGIESLAVPPLGCGNGGLDWDVVGPTLHRHLRRLDIPVSLYAPAGTLPERIQTSYFVLGNGAATSAAARTERTKIKPAWTALVEILRRVQDEPYHWPIGRTTFQNLAYFATSAGLPTGLQYVRGSFGPFSSDLKPIVTQLVNNGVLDEQRRGQVLGVAVGPTFPDAAGSCRNDLERWEAVIGRVADLFLRMRTQDAEIAATVRYSWQDLAAASSERATEIEVLREVMCWKQRRTPLLVEREVAASIRHLNMLGWIDALPSPELPIDMEAELAV